MTYVYIANAPSDLEFVKRLEGDLQAAGIELWYDNGSAGHAEAYSYLEKATHLIVVLSPDVLLHEQALGAMEYAKQKRLQRIALRLAPIESMPPQLQGVLPLNFSDEAAYQDGLETLLEDFKIISPEPDPELPAELLTAVYSENSQIRRNAVDSLLEYRNADDENMKRLARDELRALAFRERDSGIKNFARTAIQLFDQGERPETPSEDKPLPTKEELAKQAEGRAVIIEEALARVHFWETNRWYPVLAVLGILVGVVLFIVGGHYAYLIPAILVGLVLPYLNVLIRQNGAFDWKMPGPLLGNAIFGLIVTGVASVALMAGIPELENDFLIINVVIGVVMGLVIGWLSAVELEP